MALCSTHQFVPPSLFSSQPPLLIHLFSPLMTPTCKMLLGGTLEDSTGTCTTDLKMTPPTPLLSLSFLETLLMLTEPCGPKKPLKFVLTLLSQLIIALFFYLRLYFRGRPTDSGPWWLQMLVLLSSSWKINTARFIL